MPQQNDWWSQFSTAPQENWWGQFQPVEPPPPPPQLSFLENIVGRLTGSRMPSQFGQAVGEGAYNVGSSLYNMTPEGVGQGIETAFNEFGNTKYHPYTRLARSAGMLAGYPVDAMEQKYDEGNYAGLLGDVVVPTALLGTGFLGGGKSGIGKGTRISIERGPEVTAPKPFDWVPAYREYYNQYGLPDTKLLGPRQRLLGAAPEEALPKTEPFDLNEFLFRQEPNQTPVEDFFRAEEPTIFESLVERPRPGANPPTMIGPEPLGETPGHLITDLANPPQKRMPVIRYDREAPWIDEPFDPINQYHPTQKVGPFIISHGKVMLAEPDFPAREWPFTGEHSESTLREYMPYIPEKPKSPIETGITEGETFGTGRGVSEPLAPMEAGGDINWYAGGWRNKNLRRLNQGNIRTLDDVWNSMEILGKPNKRELAFYDPERKLQPHELEIIRDNPITRDLLSAYDEIVDSILTSTGRQDWIDQVTRVGVTLNQREYGVYVPKPGSGNAILINPFQRYSQGFGTPAENSFHNVITALHEVGHVGSRAGETLTYDPPIMPDLKEFDFTIQDLNDPRVGSYLQSYLKERERHGGLPGHGLNWATRLGEIYAKFGGERAFQAAKRIEKIITDESGGYRPELQRLLQLYYEAGRRVAVRTGFPSGTGVKSTAAGGRTSNYGRDIGPNGIGVSGESSALAPLESSANVGLSKYVPPGGGKKPPGGKSSGGNVPPPKGPKNISRQAGPPPEMGPVQEAWLFSKAYLTIGDISFPLRQGKGLMAWPLEYSKNLKHLFTSWSKPKSDWLRIQIQQDPYWELVKNHKTFRTLGEGWSREEQLQGSWVEQGPPGLEKIYSPTVGAIARGSNRAFTDFGAKVRFDITKKILQAAEKNGLNLQENPYYVNMIADAIGNISGRGNMKNALWFLPGDVAIKASRTGIAQKLGMEKSLEKFGRTNIKGNEAIANLFEHTANALNHIFWSPRNMATQAQVMNPYNYVRQPKVVRNIYWRSLAGRISYWATMTGLGMLLMPDASVELDPANADFGKLRIGNTRIDFTAGILPWLVATYRMAPDKFGGGRWVSSSTGKEHLLSSDYTKDRFEVGTEFVSQKMHPFLNQFYQVYLKNRDFKILQMAVPMAAQSLIEVLDEDPELAPILLPFIFGGEGVQSYDKWPGKPQPGYVPRRGGNLKFNQNFQQPF